MCGILGIYNYRKTKRFDRELFKNSLLEMNHRGPDDHNIVEIDQNIILGHTRLSIIDNSERNKQPFNLDERYYMVYNGEVYNYPEIRNELIEAGYKFSTRGDTEVILKAYHYWGEKCVTMFNGMWAIAIYDKTLKTLFCSRDRFGIKPFYYSVIDGQLVFSSEIKGILKYFPDQKNPNFHIISNYCRKGIGAQTEESWFRNILRLKPSHNMIISPNGIETYRYWDYPREVDRSITFDAAVSKYREILSDAIEIRMRSDVPVGFTLSSGIDSTSIVCLLKNKFGENKNSYTADYHEAAFHREEKKNFRNNIDINESAIVKKLTEELDLTSHIVEIKYDNYVEELRSVIRFMESGHSSPAIFPLNQLFCEARKDVTVVLEGQGADELLAGYIPDAFPVFMFELLKKMKLRTLYNEFSHFSKVYSIKMSAMLFIRESDMKFLKRLYYRVSGIDSFFTGELKSFTEIPDYPESTGSFDDKMNEHLFKLHTGCLVSLLHYGDAISMSHSMESRQPFMDYRLVDFLFSLPFNFKIRDGKGKYLHRQSMKNIVPDFILDNPVKLGFDSPIHELFTHDGPGSAIEILLSGTCISRGLFSRKALEDAFKKHCSGKKDYSRLFFRMLNTELWFREFID